MAALIDQTCSVCGQQHAFCDPKADMFIDRAEYEFMCPDKLAPGRIIVPQWAKVVGACPRGADREGF